MQLRLAVMVLAAGAGSLLLPLELRADVEAASHLLIFTEPSRRDEGVRVIHPQTEVSASGAGLNLRAGYEMDIVSGATPRVYGGGDGPDAITGATFSDLRQAARVSTGFEAANVALQAGYSYGWESDYRSHSLTVSARGDFLERNFSLSLAYTRNFDEVCDQANPFVQSPLERQPLAVSDECFQAASTTTTTRALHIHSFEPALSFTPSPLLLLQAGLTLQILEGFQSNPYRAVRMGHQGREPQERLPEHRQRYAVFARAHRAVPLLRGALRLGGRLYRDTWDVEAATVDGEWLQYLGPSIIVGLRGRYHRQGGAIFFRTPAELRLLGPTGAYFTGDRELAPLSNLLGGVKLSFVRVAPPEARALLQELEIVVRYDLLVYEGADDIPNADRPMAHAVQAGISLRF